MTVKIPPPPFLTGTQWAGLNRWLLELTSFLNGNGITTFADGTTAVTQPPGDNSTLLATDAFVLANGGGIPSTTIPLVDATPGLPGSSLTYSRGDHVHPTDTSRAALASPAFTGVPTTTTPATADSSTKIASTAYVQNVVVSFAPLASPALTGTPTAPTPAPGDNSTNIATTAFVQAAVVAGSGAGVAKAWGIGTLAGATFTFRSGLNITSFVRTGTGQFTITLTAGFASAFYAIQVGSTNTASNLAADDINIVSATVFTITHVENGTATDPSYISFSAFGT